MAMETVTDYKCDRCGASEIKNGATIFTLTIRERTSGTPGQGRAVVSQHVCAERCLKIVKASMTPVGKPGRKPGTNSGTKPTTTTKIAKAPSRTATKRGTKKASAPVSRKITAQPTEDTRAATIKAVRAITRSPGGGYAKGYNPQKERAMIVEREKINSK